MGSDLTDLVGCPLPAVSQLDLILDTIPFGEWDIMNALILASHLSIMTYGQEFQIDKHTRLTYITTIDGGWELLE